MNLKPAIIAVLLLAMPASASAAITASSITTPADNSPYAFDAAAPAHIANVSGTTTGSGNADVRCAHQNGSAWSYSAVLATVSGATWGPTDVTLPGNRALCRLIAVPEGTSPTDPSAFTGPRLRMLITSAVTDNKGQGNQGKQYDFAGSAAGPDAEAFLGSAAGGGVDEALLLSGAPGAQGEVFGSADYISDTDPTTGGDPDTTATGLTVDGTNSFVGASWEQQVTPALTFVFGSYTPFPGVTAVGSVAADGSLALAEHDTIVRCTTTDPNYYPPAGFTCQGLQDAGVALDLTTTINPAGSVVSRQWSFKSTDAHSHVVHLVTVDNAGSNSGSRSWRLPGEAGYAAHTDGDVVPVPVQTPWTVRFHTDGAADGDTSEGVGAIAFGEAPASLRFTGPYSLVRTTSLTVPATGDVKLRAILMSEATQAALESDIAAAEAALAGTPVTPPGGNPPPPGGNPPPAAKPAAPRLVKQGKAKLRGAKLALGYALDCPGAGGACSAVLKLSRKGKRAKVLAKGTVRAAAGKRAKLVLKVSRKNRAKLRHGRFTLKVTLLRPPLTGAKATKTLKLR